MVTLYKNLCKNVTLRKEVLVLLQIIQQMSLDRRDVFKIGEIVNHAIFVPFSFW